MKKDNDLVTSPPKYESYPLYLKLSVSTIIALGVVWGLIMYFLWPGLLSLGKPIAVTIEVILAIVPLMYAILWAIMFVAVNNWLTMGRMAMRLSNRGLYSLFPAMTVIGKVIAIDRDRISQSLIALINHLVSLHLYTVEPQRLLLLTPHCLQKNTCVHKVTSDVNNCKQCGQCQVGDLLRVAKKYECQFVVVTGGTLARMMVKAARPKAIIAIACERDLVSGMQDVFPIPVVGILNERPHGPCCNTRVNMEAVERTVRDLIYGK